MRRLSLLKEIFRKIRFRRPEVRLVKARSKVDAPLKQTVSQKGESQALEASKSDDCKGEQM